MQENVIRYLFPKTYLNMWVLRLHVIINAKFNIKLLGDDTKLCKFMATWLVRKTVKLGEKVCWANTEWEYKLCSRTYLFISVIGWKGHNSKLVCNWCIHWRIILINEYLQNWTKRRASVFMAKFINFCWHSFLIHIILKTE